MSWAHVQTMNASCVTFVELVDAVGLCLLGTPSRSAHLC